MRDRETLFFELNIVAACTKETQLAWFNSLEPEEREIVHAWFEEMMECVTKVMAQFKTAFQKLLDRLSPVVLEYLREMAREAEGDDAENTG